MFQLNFYCIIVLLAIVFQLNYYFIVFQLNYYFIAFILAKVFSIKLLLNCSRTSKGFSSQQTMQQCGCVEVFTEVMTIFLRVLETPVQRQLLHASVRQYLHRMVVCLETEVLPFVPVALEHLLKDPDARELCEFLPLLNQIITKFKVGLILLL